MTLRLRTPGRSNYSMYLQHDGLLSLELKERSHPAKLWDSREAIVDGSNMAEKDGEDDSYVKHDA